MRIAGDVVLLHTDLGCVRHRPLVITRKGGKVVTIPGH
jgi:hypothetical protein